MSWLSSIKSSDAFAYRTGLICRKCAEKIQGLHLPDPAATVPTVVNRAGLPVHCNWGNVCIDPIILPSKKVVARPLNTQLDGDGIDLTRRRIAENLFYGTASQKAISRLWLHIHRESIGPRSLIRVSTEPPAMLNTKDCLKDLFEDPDVFPVPFVYSDLEFIYGCATCSDKIILWRLGISDVGRIGDLHVAYLPPSEIDERDTKDLLEEAISVGAWD